MSKHTPTPWVLSKESPTIFKRDFSSIGSDSGYLIGSVMGRDDSGFYADDAEARANARLIVTAVNYHDRLREALEYLLEQHPRNGVYHDCTDNGLAECEYCEGVRVLAELDNLEKQP